jgi:hypothetical protein
MAGTALMPLRIAAPSQPAGADAWLQAGRSQLRKGDPRHDYQAAKAQSDHLHYWFTTSG